MTGFQIEYLCFGGSLTLSGLVMIVTYTVSFPWWKDLLGRMMIVYASAEVAMSTLLMSTVVFRFGPEWFRPIWFALQTILTGCFVFQTWIIIKLRRARVSLVKEEDRV